MPGYGGKFRRFDRRAGRQWTWIYWQLGAMSGLSLPAGKRTLRRDTDINALQACNASALREARCLDIAAGYDHVPYGMPSGWEHAHGVVAVEPRIMIGKGDSAGANARVHD